jgi:hypothetical protein
MVENIDSIRIRYYIFLTRDLKSYLERLAVKNYIRKMNKEEMIKTIEKTIELSKTVTVLEERKEELNKILEDLKGVE